MKRLLVLLLLLAGPALAQTTLRGSIGPTGYRPPSTPVSVVWRRPGAPDFFRPLNTAVQWVDDVTFRLRYGAGDPETIGRQITAIQAEQNGLRAWAILKELYAQAGLSRVPPSIGQEVWDFAIVEVGDHPPDWCDFVAFTGRPDPYCGAVCPPCSGRGGGRPAATPPASATGLRIEDGRLHFSWTGAGRPSFTAYTRGEGGFVLLGTARASPMRLNPAPALGDRVLLYVRVPGGGAAESQIVVGGELPPPPGEPPPPPPAVDDLERRLDELWRLLKPLVREWYRPAAASTGAIKPSVFPD